MMPTSSQQQMLFPKGRSPEVRIKNSAADMLDIISGERRANVLVIKEIISIVSKIEENYPQGLRTSERLQGLRKIDYGMIALHNSPHYGNTELRRSADLLATAAVIRLRSKSKGIGLIEVRTTVDTNNTDDRIYMPATVLAASTGIRLDVQQQLQRQKLSELPNPFDDRSVGEIEKDSSQLSSDAAKNAIRSALSSIQRQPGFARAMRLWNIAVRQALLAESAITLPEGDILLDVPDSEFMSKSRLARQWYEEGNSRLRELLQIRRDDPVRFAILADSGKNDFLDFVSKEEGRLSGANGLETLTGSLNTAIAMMPALIKGGRSMHMYYPSILRILGDRKTPLPTYIQMPELNDERMPQGIPTILQASKFARDKFAKIEEALAARLLRGTAQSQVMRC